MTGSWRYRQRRYKHLPVMRRPSSGQGGQRDQHAQGETEGNGNPEQQAQVQVEGHDPNGKQGEKRYVVRIVSLADGRPSTCDGRWLVGCDFNAHGGRGQVTCTPYLEKAHRFATASFALDYWRTISTATPWRDDGMPNRPLTAYTVEVLSLEDARAQRTD